MCTSGLPFTGSHRGSPREPSSFLIRLVSNSARASGIRNECSVFLSASKKLLSDFTRPHKGFSWLLLAASLAPSWLLKLSRSYGERQRVARDEPLSDFIGPQAFPWLLLDSPWLLLALPGAPPGASCSPWSIRGARAEPGGTRRSQKET